MRLFAGEIIARERSVDRAALPRGASSATSPRSLIARGASRSTNISPAHHRKPTLRRSRRGRGRFDELIGGADDRFLVFDHEERVALVAQIVHHADQPADIARMQADARFVHDEKRVHERCAEAGGEIDALHFAAAESAGGTIEREITEPDFAKITAGARTTSSRNISAVESLARVSLGKISRGRSEAAQIGQRRSIGDVERRRSSRFAVIRRS